MKRLVTALGLVATLALAARITLDEAFA